MKTTSFTRAAVLFSLVAIMASGEITVDANTQKRNLKKKANLKDKKLKKGAKEAVVKKRVVKKAIGGKKATGKKVVKKGGKKNPKRNLRPKDGAN